MPTTVAIYWVHADQEFRVVPVEAGLANATRNDRTYFTEDYADAVGTAQTMAGAGGAIIDRTPLGKRFRVYRTIMSPVVTEWGVGVRLKDETLHIERAYAAPTNDVRLCDAALRHAVAGRDAPQRDLPVSRDLALAILARVAALVIAVALGVL